MKLLEKNKEKQPIQDEIASHHFKPHSPCEEQDNFVMGIQRRGEIFEQDDDVTTRVHLQAAEF